MTEKVSLTALRDDPSIIQDFYFSAMTAGYASERSKPKAVPNQPGSKQNVFERDAWLLSDTWHITPVSTFSGGATHIYFDGTLVWMMHYFGQYPDCLIPFLKRALAEEYRKRTFNAGRGPRQVIFKNEGLIYRNQPEASRFDYFCGLETLGPALGALDDKNSGWHRYHGGLML